MALAITKPTPNQMRTDQMRELNDSSEEWRGKTR
jgi:hypothetical protein